MLVTEGRIPGFCPSCISCLGVTYHGFSLFSLWAVLEKFPALNLLVRQRAMPSEWLGSTLLSSASLSRSTCK